MEPAESSGASTPPEREPVMDCCLVLIFFSMNPSPFVPAWQLDWPLESSAVQESSTRYVFK